MGGQFTGQSIGVMRYQRHAEYLVDYEGYARMYSSPKSEVFDKTIIPTPGSTSAQHWLNLPCHHHCLPLQINFNLNFAV